MRNTKRCFLWPSLLAGNAGQVLLPSVFSAKYCQPGRLLQQKRNGYLSSRAIEQPDQTQLSDFKYPSGLPLSWFCSRPPSLEQWGKFRKGCSIMRDLQIQDLHHSNSMTPRVYEIQIRCGEDALLSLASGINFACRLTHRTGYRGRLPGAYATKNWPDRNLARERTSHTDIMDHISLPCTLGRETARRLVLFIKASAMPARLCRTTGLGVDSPAIYADTENTILGDTTCSLAPNVRRLPMGRR